MWRIIFISLILIPNLGLPQSENIEYEFRQFNGKLIDVNGLPVSGQTIIIKGTNIGTQTDFDGNFCLIVPKNMTIFIELPFCFEQIFREVKPTDNFIKLEIGKNKQSSKIALLNWKRMLPELNSFLYKFYNSKAYKDIEKNVCE